jgi:DNA-directed RNA polymerase II subunit RPB1
MKTVTKFGGKIEHTTLSHVVKNSAIYYDPEPSKTVVKEDEELLALYSDVPLIEA